MSTNESSLRTDYDKVLAAGDAVRETEDRILKYQATPDEVMPWYLAQDPLDQTKYELTAEVIGNGNLEAVSQVIYEDARVMSVMEHGAAILAMHTMVPDDVIMEANWYDLLNEHFTSASVDGPLTCLDVLDCAFELAEKEELSVSDCQNIKVVIEMLTASGSTGTIEAAEILDRTGDVVAAYRMLAVEQGLTERMFDERKLCINLAELVLVDLLHLLEGDSSAKEVALDALPFLGSIVLAGIPAPGSEHDSGDFMELRYDMLAIYMSMLDLIATGPDRIQLRGKSVKGALHEAVWFLDMMILREVRRGDFQVWHSTTNQDRPEVGYPENNRGFDFILTGYGKPEFAVQLKSSPESQKKKNAKEYHPEIRKKFEPNFQEFNGNVLGAKLNLYRKFIASGGDVGLYGDIIQKKALATAVEIYDEFEELGPISYSEVLRKLGNFGITFATPPPDYDQRIRAIVAGDSDPGLSRRHRRLLSAASRKNNDGRTKQVTPTKRTGARPNQQKRKKKRR